MSKPAHASEILPAALARALKDLGGNLALARQRRKESQRTWARPVHATVPCPRMLPSHPSRMPEHLVRCLPLTHEAPARRPGRNPQPLQV